MADAFLALIWLASGAWVVYDVWIVQEKMKTSLKILWTFLAFVLPFLGPAVYYFLDHYKNG